MVVVMKLKYVDQLSGGPQAVAKAKAAGKYKGRKPTAKAKAKEVLELHAEGVGVTEIARRVGIGRASVYRILKEEGV